MSRCNAFLATTGTWMSIKLARRSFAHGLLKSYSLEPVDEAA
jgi:hypothetical protein